MRWLVEVTALGKSEKESLFLEADSWQKALQSARSQRNDTAPMSGFSIELLDDGCRAVDPVARVRYDVRKAPEDGSAIRSQPPRPAEHAAEHAAPAGHASNTPTSPTVSPSATQLAAPPVMAQAAAVKRPQPSSSPVRTAAAAPGMALQTSHAPLQPPPGMMPTDAMPVVATPLHASAPARADVAASVPSQIIFKREQDPTDAMPLAYREYVYLVPPGTSETLAETLLVTQLELVRSSLERLPPGKLVNLAVFDVAVQGKPPVPPLVVLGWRDWRGPPVVTFPRRPEPATEPIPLVHPAAPVAQAPREVVPVAAPVVAPPVVAPPVVVAPAAPVAPVAPAPAVPPPAVAPVAPSPFAAPPVPTFAPPVAANPFAPPAMAPVAHAAPSPFVVPDAPLRARPPTPRAIAVPGMRVRGEDLIADLFEAMHDLHFVRDAIEGGEFCLALAMEKLPSQMGIVHLYDIDKREFLVTSTRGNGTSPLLLRRHPENDALLLAAMKKRTTLVVANGAQSEAASLDRYEVAGGPRSLMIAPVMQHGRFLGAIELVNPLDGLPFTDAEGNALNYIAEQFAEFLASHGIVTDPARISNRPPPGP